MKKKRKKKLCLRRSPPLNLPPLARANTETLCYITMPQTQHAFSYLFQKTDFYYNGLIADTS